MSAPVREVQRVIFRAWRNGGDVIAFMPDQTANPDRMMSYEHVGQHSEADYFYCLQRTRPATAEEYAPLLEELKGIGYELRVVRRLGRAS